jgi:hypothetical protein
MAVTTSSPWIVEKITPFYCRVYPKALDFAMGFPLVASIARFRVP